MSQALVKSEPSELRFVPFGAKDEIKLSISIIQKHVCTPTKGGRICSDRDAMRFLMLCQAQRLNPFAGDAFLVGYDNRDGGANFSLITSHVAFLKRAETCDDYEGMESGVIILGEDGKITEREGDFVLPTENCVGGWAKVYRKGRKPTYRRLSIDAMKPNYETAFWNKQKAPGQVVKCAEADSLRSTFPTLLGGLQHEGEIIDITPSTTVEVSRVDSKLVSTTREPETAESVGEEQNQAAPVKAEGKSKPAELTPQQQVANITSEYPFDAVKAFIKEEYPAMQIDDCATFDDMKPQDARILVRARDGMLAWLKERAK